MTKEEMKNFIILPHMVPELLKIGGWLPEEIEALSEAELEWYAVEGNRAIREHFKTV